MTIDAEQRSCSVVDADRAEHLPHVWRDNGGVWLCGGKPAFVDQATRDALTTDRDALRAALDGLMPRCGTGAGQREECHEFGVWEYRDHDGAEQVCDKHKHSRHFHTDGPFLRDDLVLARQALAGQPERGEG